MVFAVGRLPLIESDLRRPRAPERVLALGTCQIETLIGRMSEHGLQTDHYLMQSYTNSPLPDVDPGPYTAVVVALTLRHIMQAGAHRVDESVWVDCLFHARSIGDGLEQQHYDACASLITEHVKRLAFLAPGKPVFFLSFPEPKHNYLGNLMPRYSLSNIKFFVESLNRVLAEEIGRYPDLYFFDINELVALIGSASLLDDYVTGSAHASFLSDSYGAEDRIQPHTLPLDMWDSRQHLVTLAETFAQRMSDNISIIRAPLAIKAIIVDLDDTLWRGIAAEQDGSPQQFTEGWPLGMAEALLIYKARGGMLGICSKNDETVARQRFDDIFHGRLRLSDFASVRINFDRKSENIAAILDEMNILARNAMFVDDNPREIAEVRERFPDMLFLSAEHYDWRRKILLMPETQVASLDRDAVLRTRSVQAKVEHEATKASMSRDEWLMSLELVEEIAVIRDSHHERFGRAFELINKTNQFNTTGRRWEKTELVALFAAGGVLVCAFLKDRIVDHGMIGVAIVDGPEIKQVVLSCRVFGNDAEYVLGRSACALALQAGSPARGIVIDSGRNKTSHAFFEKMGFSRSGDGVFVSPVLPAAPAHIQVCEIS